MYLTKRHKQYLTILMEKKGFVTSRELAVEAGVTARTVKADIVKLNEILKHSDTMILSKPGSGYQLAPEKRQGMKEVGHLLEQMQYEKSFHIPDNGPERVEYIAKKLLTLDYYITMEELRLILYVSRSTLNHDMKQVRRLLNLYGLEVIHTSHRGIRLKGTESAIRRCMAALFFKNDKGRGRAEYGPSYEPIRQIQSVLAEKAGERSVNYPDDVIWELALQIFIAVQRCRFLKEVEFDSRLKVSQWFIDMAVSISSRLGELLGVVMPDIEIHNMAGHLQFRSLQEEGGKEPQYFEWVIGEMFESVKKKTGLDLSGQEALSYYLKLHLPRTAARCKHHILIENPILNEIFCNYPLAVDIANVAVKVLEKELDIAINSNEFGYLALYFNMSMVTYGERQNKTLILVCPGSRAEEVMYLTELQSLFGNFVRNLRVCRMDELLSMKFTGTEVVASTASLPFLPDYVRRIQIGCNIAGSFSAIMEALTSFPSESFNIDEFMDSRLWMANVQVDTPGMYFETLFNQLCELQIMDFGEAEILYQNIERFGQELGNQVVLIRAENPFLTPFVHVTVTKEPFLWEQHYARVILFINMSDEKFEFRNGIYNFLGKWFRYKDKIEESIRNADFQRFMEEIKK